MTQDQSQPPLPPVRRFHLLRDCVSMQIARLITESSVVSAWTGWAKGLVSQLYDYELLTSSVIVSDNDLACLQ